VLGSMLSGDEQRIIFSQMCNVLGPGAAVAFSSASSELRTLTQAQQQQLKAGHEAATALGRKAGKGSCKELREAKRVEWDHKGLSVDEMATLGRLGSVLPVLEELRLSEPAAGPDGMQRLMAGLGVGAMPALATLEISCLPVGDTGAASALAAALDRGALPRLKLLDLGNAGIGDAGLVALAPALRRRPALEELRLWGNPLGDEGLAALVAPPPPPAGAPPPPTRGLTKLKVLSLSYTQITDVGCVALASALESGALPALKNLFLRGIPASAAAKVTVQVAVGRDCMVLVLE